MTWVLAHLKSILRREKMIGSKHKQLAGDPMYKASAEFSSQRIPQLQKAIEILEQYKDQAPAPAKKKQKQTTAINQIKIWQK